MKKTFKVVMLPTEKVSNIFKHSDNNNGKLFMSRFEINTGLRQDDKPQAQHLYIISYDDEIKDGDWYYNIVRDTVQQFKGQDRINDDNWKKIIATTDKSLIEGIRWNKEWPLPQLPNSFIKTYVKTYNEGKHIVEVDLEVEIPKESIIKIRQMGLYDENEKSMMDLLVRTVKINHDNTVIINQKNTSLSVFNLYVYDASCPGLVGTFSSIEKAQEYFDENINLDNTCNHQFKPFCKETIVNNPDELKYWGVNKIYLKQRKSENNF